MPQPGSPQRCCPWYTTFGRLKPGVTIERARAELTAIAQRVSSTHPGGGAVAEVRVVPLRETLVGDHALTLFGLFGAVGCILLIGSANVANLLLSRGVSRRREVMTRLALGATRWRLARQLLTESLMLGAAGAGARAVAVPLGAGRHRHGAGRSGSPSIDGTRLDLTVLAFSACLALDRQRGLRPDPARRLARAPTGAPAARPKPAPAGGSRDGLVVGGARRGGHRGRDRGSAGAHGRQSRGGGRRLRHGTHARRLDRSHQLDAPVSGVPPRDSSKS